MGMHNFKFIGLVTSIILILTFTDTNLAQSYKKKPRPTNIWIPKSMKCVVGGLFKDPDSCNMCACLDTGYAICNTDDCEDEKTDDYMKPKKTKKPYAIKKRMKCFHRKLFKDPDSCNMCNCINHRYANCNADYCKNETTDDYKKPDIYDKRSEDLDEEEFEDSLFCILGDKPFVDRCRRCVCYETNVVRCRRILNCVFKEKPDPDFNTPYTETAPNYKKTKPKTKRPATKKWKTTIKTPKKPTRKTSKPHYSVFTTKTPEPHYSVFTTKTLEPYYSKEEYYTPQTEASPDYAETKTPGTPCTEFTTPHSKAEFDYVEKIPPESDTKCDPSDEPLIDGCKKCVCIKPNVMNCRKIPNCHYWDHLPNGIKFAKEPPPDFMAPEITTEMYEKCEFGGEPIIDGCKKCTCLKNGAMSCRRIPKCNYYDQVQSRHYTSNSKAAGSCRNKDIEFSKEKCLCICIKNKPWCPFYKWKLRCPWAESPLPKWQKTKITLLK